MPTLWNNAASITLVPKTYSWVEAKLSYADNWQYVPYVVPVQCVDVAAPEVGYADFQYDFGLIKREDRTTFGYATTYGLLDYYVRIMVQNEGYYPQQVWVGIVTDDETTADRPGFSSGEQKIRAYQLTHLLDREPIANARTETAAGDGTTQTIGWVPTFNQRSSIGLSLSGNRSEEPAEDGWYVFGKEGSLWTNYDIAEYLCAYHKPANLTIYLAGQSELLSRTVDLWDFEGYTLWDALNKLIDRKRGVGFYPWCPGDGTMYLWVFSLTERDIQFGSATLSANQLQTFYEFPSARPYTHLTGEIPFRKTTVNQYDRLVIRGERAKVTGTYSMADETLEKGWTQTLEDDYVTAKGTDPEENDRYRSLDKFHGVFSRFTVPNDWDGAVGDGEGGGKESLRLRSLNDGTMETRDNGPLYLVDKTFLRENPFQLGKDYGVEPPTDYNPTDQEPEFQPLLAIAKKEPDGEVVVNAYYVVDRLDESLADASSASVRPTDKRLGVDVSFSPRHLLALSHIEEGGETNAEPLLDYEKLLVTATFESDECPQIIKENFSGNSSESMRTLVLDIPGIEYWYVAPGTVVDIDPDNETKLVRYTAESQFIRGEEDLAKLEAVAAFVTAWYGVRRQAVQIPLKQVGMFVQIGTLLTDIRNSYFSEPVRTVVTGRKIDFIAGVTVIETGYNALDIATSSNIDKKRIRKGRLG